MKIKTNKHDVSQKEQRKLTSKPPSLPTTMTSRVKLMRHRVYEFCQTFCTDKTSMAEPAGANEVHIEILSLAIDLSLLLPVCRAMQPDIFLAATGDESPFEGKSLAKWPAKMIHIVFARGFCAKRTA